MKSTGIILLTFLLGLMFLVTPLPQSITLARPFLILLIVVYWALYAPEKVGVTIAWVMGLFTDFLYGIMLGPYALGFAVSAYLMIHLNARFNMFPLFQQTLFVGMLVAGVQALAISCSVLLGHGVVPWDMGWSVLTSMLCWPLVMLVLDSARGVCSFEG